MFISKIDVKISPFHINHINNCFDIFALHAGIIPILN